jgi:hypothetical protein
MLPLETKQSGGKLLHHSDLRGGGFLGGVGEYHAEMIKKGNKLGNACMMSEMKLSRVDFGLLSRLK